MTSLPDLSLLAEWDDRLREVANDTGAVEDAIAQAERLLASARVRGDPPEEVRLLGYLGNASRMVGRYDRASSFLREAAELASRHGDERARAVALIRLGETHRCAGALEEAVACLDEALALTRMPGLADLEDFALQHLGKTYLDAGDGERARERLLRALSLREVKGDTELIHSTKQALERAGAPEA